MKFPILFLVILSGLVTGCADFPGVFTIEANPSGSITVGATIDPAK